MTDVYGFGIIASALSRHAMKIPRKQSKCFVCVYFWSPPLDLGPLSACKSQTAPPFRPPAQPCLQDLPGDAGSDEFRWMSRTLEPTKITFSRFVISQFCVVVFQLLTSRRVRLKATVLASPGARSTSSKPRSTPQGLSSPPSWRYCCAMLVSEACFS